MIEHGLPKPTKIDPRYSRTVLEDGRIRYTYPRKDGAGVHVRHYTPVPLAERKYRKHRPDEGASTFRRRWYSALAVLPDDQRVMPETNARSDNEHRRAVRREAGFKSARAASARTAADPRR